MISFVSFTNEIKPIDGGAIKINNVGNNLLGSGLWKIMRLKNITNKMPQKIKPILKKNHEISNEK